MTRAWEPQHSVAVEVPLPSADENIATEESPIQCMC